jgi:hypothetical protein
MIFYKILLLGIFLNVGYLQPMDNVQHLSLINPKIKKGFKGVSEAERRVFCKNCNSMGFKGVSEAERRVFCKNCNSMGFKGNDEFPL